MTLVASVRQEPAPSAPLVFGSADTGPMITLEQLAANRDSLLKHPLFAFQKVQERLAEQVLLIFAREKELSFQPSFRTRAKEMAKAKYEIESLENNAFQSTGR